ncbi:unnamed protein product [Trichobilharzia szidati]|nr:unnamed protein product [Trichobilharzia szidati]
MPESALHEGESSKSYSCSLKFPNIFSDDDDDDNSDKLSDDPRRRLAISDKNVSRDFSTITAFSPSQELNCATFTSNVSISPRRMNQ